MLEISRSTVVTSPNTDVNNLGGVVNKSPNFLTTTVHLYDTKFLPWSQSTKLYITGKDKAAYLIGAAKIPKPTEQTFTKWEAENTTVIS